MATSKAGQSQETMRGPATVVPDQKRRDQDLKCGIALQLRLQPRSSSSTIEAKDLGDFRHFLAEAYAVHVEEQKISMPAMYTPEHLAMFRKDIGEPEAWIIGGAPNLSASKNDKSSWSVQIESPLFKVEERPLWNKRIEFLFEFLNGNCKVKTDRDCHVMVRVCAPEGWTFVALQNVARSILWFEDAFVPKIDHFNESPSYRDCMDPFAKRNRKENGEILNGNVAGEDELWRNFQGTKSRSEVVRLMCPGGDSQYRWDLTVADKDHEAMIEFRGGNGGHTPNIAMLWMTIAVNLVIKGMKKGTHEGLARFPHNEGGCDGWVKGKATIG